MIRLFVALEIAAPVREAIAAWLDRARRGAPRARWAPPEQLHLTLRFLAEVAGERVALLSASLRRALELCDALHLTVGGGGAFPPRGRVRVLWLGVRGGERLGELQTRVAEAVESALDLPPERRPFHPHLTVARCRPPWPRRLAEQWIADVPDGLGAPFTVDEVVLVRSELETTGARHSILQRFPLQGRAG